MPSARPSRPSNCFSARLPPRLGESVLEVARGAFVHGVQLAALGGAGLLVAAAVLAAPLLRGIRNPKDDPPKEDAPARVLLSSD
ncbi:hypothetical protein OG501_10705 [Streptomyces niveus]|uniref:hypothetical protein n=1 Tax=Streptomyces niveus TaxID=193462 RepID=UPI00386E6A5B